MNKIAVYSGVPKNSINGYGMKHSPINYNAVLVANVEQNFTVPEYLNGGQGLIYAEGPSYLATFKIGYSLGNVYLAINETAEVPSGDFSLYSSSMLDRLNESRFVFSGDVISVIATQNVQISIVLYALT